ncbi:unnamed protein product [Fraxinus pennsylvanica]|uniref:Uncharacterized protein n=1 Tax=Fraxinus pennsylvanica TaxID=56036 RepID=A0AAD2EDG3_9LAMI|nr:unnamed protein product [Fraxinus pennsylvanica]
MRIDQFSNKKQTPPESILSEIRLNRLVRFGSCWFRFFCYIAELNTESRQKDLVKWVLTRRTTNVDLEAADLEGDGIVGAAEFVLYKLKEMGKINQEDILLFMDEFENLDFDQSGTLSGCDLKLAQPAQM